MAENKEQTLANLYSIRAGISAVASQRNKVDAIKKQTADEVITLEGEIRSLNEENRKLKNDNSRLDNEIKIAKYNVDRHKNLEKPSEEEKNKKISKIVSFYRRSIFTSMIISITYILLFPGIIKPKAYEAVASGVTDFVVFLVWLLMVVFCINLFLCLCFLIWAFGSKIPEEKSNINRRYKESVSYYEYDKKELDFKIHEIEKNNSIISSNTEQISNNEALIAEKQKEIEMRKSAAEKACVPYYQLGGMIQEQFENQFDSFLNLRDWKNVDIIIFAYESGRVDTMREALTYADGETRADRIVNAINASTQAICRSIQSVLHSLALSMGECFNVISRQIAEQTRKLDKISDNIENLSANTARLAENTASYSANLADLAAKVDYSNALQEQRYNSSKELVEKNEVFMLQARNYMDELYNNRYSLY